MKKSKVSLLFPVVLSLFAARTSFASPVKLSSPDGKIKVEISDAGGLLRYQVSIDNKAVLLPSELGIRSGGVNLGEEATLGKAKLSRVNERYRFFGGKREAINAAREATIPLASHGETGAVDVHVANDGVGVRMRLTAKAGRHVDGEGSSWRLAGSPVLWAAEQDNSYESTYRVTSLGELGDRSYGLPLTGKTGDVYFALAQAGLKDYGDVALRRSSDGALNTYLYADPQGWTTDDAVVQPWRVTLLARNLNDLVNSTLVANLNPAPDATLGNADWIRPGRSSWQWMAIGAPRANDQQQWVDWTKQLGFEYYLVDEGWSGWPNAWDTLKTVCTYAKSQGVAIWVWVHSNEVKDPEARKAYFRKLTEVGAVGVKIDFPPACNRWWSNWYYDTAKDAAAGHLMVDFHGAVGPTGLERTWPNVLTREGVRGHEWHMTRYRRRLEGAHDTILPFSRYLAGPGDYTPTVFEPKELQGNTWAHELAQAVVFTSPFLCFGGHPRDYVSNPAKDVLTQIPAVWDETRVLPGSEPGKVAALARRSGKNWFVAILNGEEAATMNVSLDFLRGGTWKMTQLGDAPGQGDAWLRQESTATKSSRLAINLASRGGAVLWMRQ